MGPLPTNHNESSLEIRTRTWTYSTEFELDTVDSSAYTYILVLEGIKMGAQVAVNGDTLGNVTDQFLRFSFVLDREVLSRGSVTRTSRDRRRELAPSRTRHLLTITFDPTIPTDGRFMACSGGWDWAPYTKTGDERGSRVFSFGAFKPIYIVKERFASITHVVPKVYYLGPYARCERALFLSVFDATQIIYSDVCLLS